MSTTMIAPNGRKVTLASAVSAVPLESVRERSIRLAVEVAPRPAKKGRPWVTPWQVTRARNAGEPFYQAMRFAKAATAEGAQRIAAEFQAIADEKANTGTAPLREILLREQAIDNAETLAQMDAMSSMSAAALLAYRDRAVELIAALRLNVLAVERELGL